MSGDVFAGLIERLGLSRASVLCETHGATETLVRADETSPVCPKCRQERTDAEQREQWKRERHEQLVRISCVPERFKSAGFKDFREHHPAVCDVKRHIGGYLRGLIAEPRQWAPLILSGVPGTGKTHLMCAIANNLIHAGVGCHYTTVQAMLSEIKKSYDTDGMTEASQVWKYVGNYSLLIIDEVDVMRASDNDLSLVFAVINGRYNELRSVAIATNQVPEKLGAYLTERVVDRLSENALTLKCDWPSHRRTTSSAAPEPPRQKGFR